MIGLIQPYQDVRAASASWEIIGPGIEFDHFVLPDPNHVYVARMDRNNPNVTLESILANGNMLGGRETISAMSGRYDEAINFWNGTPGARDKVVVAINGSYLETATGLPQNGMVQSGWYVKRFDNLEGWSGFGWTTDRTAFIGQCVATPSDGQVISYPATGNTQKISGVNVPRGNNQLILYTPQYNGQTRTDNSGVEVVVEMTRPTSPLALPDGAVGYVREIYDGRGSTPIPFDSIVLSASGSARTELLANILVGDVIGISQQIKSFDTDCKSSLPVDWGNTYASIGGAFTFLRDGEIKHMNETGAIVRHPRTAIAFNDHYIFFIVVDGRAPGFSIGMTFDELAAFARDSLGATWGIAQDGGGSSTMVINGVVVNHPSDPCPRTQSAPVSPRSDYPNETYLPFINQEWQDPDASASTKSPDVPGCERAVPNGIMMVALQPMQKSTSFLPMSPVINNAQADLRLGPGTNYAIVDTVPPDQVGIIVPQMSNLEGVLAKGEYWWEVDFGGKMGWVPEGILLKNNISISKGFKDQ
ncbi:MAG: phosphodiester glycosidase family protein [Chloroflexi bacterium]|nr:phosphodiester glycosidase family protein [Chloroflexota bacterium]